MPIAWFNRRTNTSYFMSALHERMVAGIAPNLETAPTACSGRVFEGHDAHGYDSGPQSYANFQWLQVLQLARSSDTEELTDSSVWYIYS